MCQPGYRLPYWQQGPFMGVDIEQATEEEYRNGFDCIKALHYCFTTSSCSISVNM